MGLSIHFSGSFRSDASLAEMVGEVKDIAEVYQWPYNIFETEFPANPGQGIASGQIIYGIALTPPHCETIPLCFLPDKRMSSPANLFVHGEPKSNAEQAYLYMLSVKTQFAGVETHKLVIHLLRYLAGKYFQDFNVVDEGKYWESGDERLLERIFKTYNDLLDAASFALENFPREPGETFEAYFERVLHWKRDTKK